VNDYVDLPIANIHHPSGNVAITPLPTINEEENDMEIDDNAEWSSPLITALSESNAIQDLCLNILTLKMKSILYMNKLLLLPQIRILPKLFSRTSKNSCYEMLLLL
jgi:hypothetical protein